MEFLDTNVLVYAASGLPADRQKTQIARALASRTDIAISLQVLQEFYVQATRESRPDPLTHKQAVGLVESFLRFPVQETTSGVMLADLAARQRFLISYWDAALIEAARALGCDVVISEDLSDGEDYNGVRVDDPFRS